MEFRRKAATGRSGHRTPTASCGLGEFFSHKGTKEYWAQPRIGWPVLYSPGSVPSRGDHRGSGDVPSQRFRTPPYCAFAPLCENIGLVNSSEVAGSRGRICPPTSKPVWLPLCFRQNSFTTKGTKQTKEAGKVLSQFVCNRLGTQGPCAAVAGHFRVFRAFRGSHPEGPRGNACNDVGDALPRAPEEPVRQFARNRGLHPISRGGHRDVSPSAWSADRIPTCERRSTVGHPKMKGPL